MTMHSMTGLLPPVDEKSGSRYNLVAADDKENEAMINVDQNNYLTLGDL